MWDLGFEVTGQLLVDHVVQLRPKWRANPFPAVALRFPPAVGPIAAASFSISD